MSVRPSALWLWDNSALTMTDYTDSIRNNSAITFSLTDAADVWYLGFDRRFWGLLANLSTNGSYSGLQWEYYNGSWELLDIITAYTFSQSRYCDWVVGEDWARIPADAAQNGGFSGSGGTGLPVSIPDTRDRFWIRIRLPVGGTQTTAAVITRLRIFPYALYTTPQRVQGFLQLPSEYAFDYSSNPSIFEIEEQIRQAESTIDQYVHKSWKFNYTTELQNFSVMGVPVIHHHDLNTVYSVAIWDGSVWDTLDEGRANEYFVDTETGQIIFTRVFVLPLRMQVIKGFQRWFAGEFERSVQIVYSYGFDSEIHKDFQMVQEIATRLVAANLIENHSFGVLTINGTDKMPYESKARIWREQAQQRMESLSSVVMF